VSGTDARVAALEAENRRMADEYVQALGQVTQLASLYAALEELHASLERSEVLRVIQEIVVNLLGSERFAIYDFSEADGALVPVVACGVEAAALPRVPLGEGLVGRVAASGVPEIRRDPGAEPVACIPLRVGAQLVGALAIHALLPHKGPLTELDERLLDVLGRQAGSALYLSALHAGAKRA
jgi:GAF domain-containing protein